MLFKTPPSDISCKPLYVNKVKARIMKMLMPVYDGAVPLTLTKSKYDFRKRSLNDASTQVVEGTFGLITNKLIHQVSTGIGYNIKQYYLPAVVTTANLYSCSYNRDDFEISTGLVSNARLNKEEFLIYGCPVPVTAAFPLQTTYLDRQKDIPRSIKWPVVVVQAQSFEKLLGLIRRAQ